MKKSFTSVSASASVLICLLFMVSCKKGDPGLCKCNLDDIVITKTVFATGLNNPRGLKFGPEGNLYVAEGGTGGTHSTVGLGLCDQVPGAGPYLGSDSGARISRINVSGMRTTVVENIPSSTTGVAVGSFVSGVADVAFIGNTLYGLLTSAGCTHGVPDFPNGVFKVNREKKTWSLIDDLSAFYKSHPVKNPFQGDFEADGTPYSMISVDDRLFSIEPNHGELDEMFTDGRIKRVIDISAAEGHIVPASMVFHNGNFYVGNLYTFPIGNKRSDIYKITPDGKISIYATGFSTVLGVLFDEAGGLYVLENTTGNDYPTPGTGDVIRVDPDGSRMTITSGLNLPTAMTFGPNETLYISNWGFGGAPGMGQVLKVDMTCAKANHFRKNNTD